MKKAVLFDLDGVIVDTALYHYQGWKMLADELGVPFDEKANEKLRGVPRRESLLMLLGKNPGEAKIKEYCDNKNEYYLKKVQSIKPKDALPGAVKTLKGLRAAGFKIGLGSSSKNAKLVLKLLGLTSYFDTIVDGTQIKKGKPDPELFITGATRLGVEPQNCLVVEDAESGIEAAIAAGMHTLGIGDVANLGMAERVITGLHEIDVESIDKMIQGKPVYGLQDTAYIPTAIEKDHSWFVIEKGFNQKKQAWRESLFTLGNGYMGIRGSVEEHDLPYPDSRPDTLVAGVFDKYESWYQAIVNLPFPFATRLTIGTETFSMTSSKVKKYERVLDMYQGKLTRSFIWTDKKGHETEVTFERVVSMADQNLAAMRATITPLNWSGNLTIDNAIDADVDNIDFHKGGYQLRPERYQFVDMESNGSFGKDNIQVTVKTKTNPYRVSESARFKFSSEGKKVVTTSKVVKVEKKIGRLDVVKVKKGQTYTMEKMIGFATSREGYKGANLVKAADKVAAKALSRGFETIAQDNATAWLRRWRAGDVRIQGHHSDQQAMRFSIFHLCQFPNPNDNKVNIGSRGLTAEMHYGACFWDTELFILPYYIYTYPEAARALMEYRYETLPEAREKAKRLFFEGAMYPWMSSFPGKEQADYWEYANIAIHIVGDVNYALQHYDKATDDKDFQEKYGAEITFETARFWASRSFYNARRKGYMINTVKGPNEYDGVVNNNTYTNWGARYNLQEAVKLAKSMKKNATKQFNALARKLKLKESEIKNWEKVAKGLFINYDAKKKLYIEDDMFMDKESFDMKKLKPGQKIITELGVSWDTLLRLQIVKQADILLLMTLFPDDFTKEQKKVAYKFYEPKTCHDSSLSPNTHAIMAAQLDMPVESMKYWDETARLDIDDTMENSFLGVHSACVGGTWQIAMLGYAGMRLRSNGFAFEPRIPARWKGLNFTLSHKGRAVEISLDKKTAHISLASDAKKAVDITVGKKTVKVKPGETVSVKY